MSRVRSNEGGYAYVMVLAAVVVLAVMAQTGYVLTSYEVKKDKEKELLFRGMAYQQAIRSFYLAAPNGTLPVFPRQLEDLLSDPRFAHRRYLRQLYSDPMGKEWNIVQAPGGGIAGVVSPSQDKPLQQDGFPAAWAAFGGAAHYSDWVFSFQPGSPNFSAGASPTPRATLPASQPITNAY